MQLQNIVTTLSHKNPQQYKNKDYIILNIIDFYSLINILHLIYTLFLINRIFQDIFVNLSTVDDSLYFMCQTEDFKFLADMIQHVPLPLRARYLFCCAPINKKMPFVCTIFLKVKSNRYKNFNIINILKIFSLQDSTAKTKQYLLTGYAEIQGGLYSLQKRYQIQYIWKQYLMYQIYTYG